MAKNGYKGKINQIYESDDGNTYFDCTPGFLKRMFKAKDVKLK